MIPSVSVPASEDLNTPVEEVQPGAEETFDENDECLDLSQFDSVLLPVAGKWDDRDEFDMSTLPESSAFTKEESTPALSELVALAVQTSNEVERVELLRTAGDLGHAGACCKVGVAYRLGKGVPQDRSEAARWFGKAAVRGSMLGAFYLGNCYHHGAGVGIDRDEAIKWYTQSAQAGHRPAQNEVARLLQQKGDLVQALVWWKSLAQSGDLVARTQTGALLENQKQFAEAVQWYQLASGEDWPEAQFRLARCFHYGLGGLANLQEAARLYGLAAKQKYALAQYSLGRLYWAGRGVSRDRTEGRRWLVQAAEQGLPIALVRVGGLLEEEKDLSAAATVFERAALSEDAAGQYHFGRMLYFGRGLQTDRARAVLYYRKAAKQGMVKAQRRLAVCYEQGKGVSLSLAKAHRWYLAAAEQGDQEAMYCLAVSYCHKKIGAVVEPAEANAQAIKWFEKAATKGHSGAQHDLGVLRFKGGSGIQRDLKMAQHWWRLAVCTGTKEIRESAQAALLKLERKRKPGGSSHSSTPAPIVKRGTSDANLGPIATV